MGMKNFLWLVALLGGLIGMQLPAQAYWDDVHYDLTYYVARLSGCTPEQAYRLAAANVSTDYSKATEPAQTPPIADILKGASAAEPARQAPRWKFHAFRNQTEAAFKNAIGGEAGAAQADAAIKAQAEALFRQGVASKNIGVFLHFAQDREPHRGFGSAWGHYFDYNDPVGSTKLARKHRLHLGGCVDWFSFHPKLTSVNLLYNTGSWISKFLASASPRQQRRIVSLVSSDDMIDAIRNLNPAPAPLTESELLLYKDYVASQHLPFMAPTLTTAQEAKFQAHKDGPNLSGVRALVVAQMKRLGMREAAYPSLTAARNQYQLTGSGAPLQMHLDQWVTVGALNLTIEAEKDDKEPVSVTIKAPITMTGETEYELISATKMTLGEAKLFNDLPIGRIIVEVERGGKMLLRSETDLLRRKTEKTFKIKESGLTGRWKTAEGWILTLTQNGKTVSGPYSGQGVSGRVAGSFDGKVFAGSYTHTEDGTTYQGVFSATLVGNDKLDGQWTETKHNVSQRVVATRIK
jgi:hypothetical protein